MSSTKRIASRMAVAALAIAAFASTASSQQSDARAIRALSDQWQRDIAAQNVDAIVALHAPDAVVMLSHAPLATARRPRAGSASAPMGMGDVNSLAGSGLTWSDFSPAGFDPGMKLAVLEGDPGAKGPYVIRLQFPAGYRFPVHWHPGIENLT